MRCVRVAVATLVAAVGAVAIAAPAHADAPEPTDFTSEIVAIEPSVPGVTVRVEPGATHLTIVVAPGTDVVVEGYEGEPYLHVAADGSVFENRGSPTWYRNRSFDGRAEPPSGVTADSPPAWQRVGSNGRHTWHDHRAHWMSDNAPPGRARGDQIGEGRVPLVVDGVPAQVVVVLRWADAPSPWPALLASLTAVLMALTASRGPGSLRRGIAVGMGLASAALVVGLAEYRAVPAVVRTSPIVWMLPVLAALVLCAAFLLRRRAPVTVALVVLASLELAVWGVLRIDVLPHAVLPTTLPGWLDRAVTAGVLAGATTLALAGMVRMVRGTDQPVSERRTAARRSSRARATRERIVPMGHPTTAAASS